MGNRILPKHGTEKSDSNSMMDTKTAQYSERRGTKDRTSNSRNRITYREPTAQMTSSRHFQESTGSMPIEITTDR